MTKKISEKELLALADKDAKAFAQWKKDGKLPKGWKRTVYKLGDSRDKRSH